jgi:NAD(P)-dependent dehydrogenase (short-subunit alcohol dehydrogenase family)
MTAGGRTVVVTGGSRGIGRALVEAFATAGESVVALGQDEAALRQLGDDLVDLSGTVRFGVCDVADEDSVTQTFSGIGDVHVLVNNAGVSETAPLERTTLSSWRHQLDVNATGPVLCTRAVMPQMKQRGDGAIVTVASTAGRVGLPYTAAYAASKHAAVGVMRVAAAELAGTRVRVNAVCPTFVRTEMTERSVERIRAATGMSERDSGRALSEGSPLGRLLEPKEVAMAVLFLASDAAAPISGQTLILDGGGIQG